MRFYSQADPYDEEDDVFEDDVFEAVEKRGRLRHSLSCPSLTQLTNLEKY